MIHLSFRHCLLSFVIFSFSLTVQAVTYPMDITITFPNGAPASGVNFVIITTDNTTHTSDARWDVASSNQVYSTTVTYTCVNNTVLFGFEVRYLDDNGDLVGGYGGGGAMNCNANPPPISFDGPLTITSGTNTPVNAGSCEPNSPNGPKYVGEPVNVTNGNMFVSHTDYVLPSSVGVPIGVVRNYNSMVQANGLFGIGWTTEYEQTLTRTSGSAVLKLKMPDGKVALFVNDSTNYSHYVSISPAVKGEISRDLSTWDYTLTYKDGSKEKFDWFYGRLLWRRDRHGNQTTLTYTSGTLTTITDAFGRTLTFSRNAAQNVSAISDATGTIATYDYFTGTNRLQTVTYPDNSKYKFEYTTISSKVYLTTVKDALDNILETHAYDSSGRATTSELDGGVKKYTLDYTNTNLATNPYTEVTDALGRVTKYYFSRQRATFVTTKTEGVCSCGGSGSEETIYEYDGALNLIKKTDALSNETTFTYDSSSNLTGITDPIGSQSFTYNSLGEVLTHTDRMSGVTTNTYSTTGSLLTTTDPLSNVTEFTYTSVGQLDTIEDARGKITDLDYDSSGRLIKITDADSNETDLTYNARARVLTVTNALNQTTEFEYDAKDRLDKVIYPDTNEVNIEYDLAGRRSSVTDELGHETTFTYDDAYRLTGITDPLSHTTSFGYDLMSNLTSQTDALGNVTNLEYDDFNRLKKIKYPLPSPSATPRLEESFTYDKNGNLETKVDTGGRTTSYDYDDANRLIKITDALSNDTHFTYNARSQMTKVKDDLNQEYTFTYDALGRTLTQTRNNQTMTFTYDAVGNRATREDYNGDDTTYTYDDLNRLTNIAYSGASGQNASYTYDDLSRLLTAVNAAGTVTFAYNNRGRLATEEDVFGHHLEYTYDAAGNRIGLELDNTAHTAYDYDNANRLTTLTDEASNDFTFAYDNANKLTSKVSPNGVTSTYDYDGMSRLKRLKHYNSTTTLYDDQFTYNAANQISQIAGLAATKVYTYDNINRLTDVSVSSSSVESYAYDSVGNRTASHLSGSYTTGSFNRLTATSSATYSYNNNGSMTGKTVGATNWTYGWDRENRMVSAGDGTNSASYDYDALGRRVKRTQSTDLQKYTHDGLDVVLDDVNSTLSKYQNGSGIDNKFKSVSAGVSKFFLGDHLGSTAIFANSSGSSVDSNSYDSFGTATNSSFTSRYQFTGREFDSLTGLQFSRARFYDKETGRFISEDPAGFIGDFNLYTYVGNNPKKFVDPLGLFPSWHWPWDYHQQIGSNALNGLATPREIQSINWSNGDFDRRTQDARYAPYHAMRRPGQSIAAARWEANAFIKNKICLAREYKSRGWYTDAMHQFGEAAHAMQDNNSPAHYDFQSAWPNTWWGIVSNFGHYWQEIVSPGKDNIRRAEDDTRRLWDYYQGTPMPFDILRLPYQQKTQTCECS